MPAIIAWLAGLLVSVAGTVVGKVLLSLGFGYAAFTGIDASITWAKAQFLAGMAGWGANTIGMASTLKVGVCVSMLLSALTVRLLMQGLTSGAIKRMVVKS